MSLTKNVAKAGGALLEEVVPRLGRQAAETGLSRSGKNVGREAIEQLLDFKNLPSKPKQFFTDNPIPVQDYPAIQHLQQTGDPRFAEYKGYLERAETPNMISITDDVNRELTEKAQQAQALRQVQELQGLRKEGEHQLGLRSGQDIGTSRISTGPEFIPGDKQIYQLDTKARKQYLEYEETIKADPAALRLHHKFMKAYSAPYFQRAWELVDAGDATVEDIIALHRYALDSGVGAGDRQSAIMMFERIPHDELHEWSRAIGIEPRGGKVSAGMGSAKKPKKFSKQEWATVKKAGVKTEEDLEYFMAWAQTKGGIDIDRGLKKVQEARSNRTLRQKRVRPSTNSPLKKETSRIKKIETFADLAEDFKTTVDDVAVPMTDEAKKLQEAWRDVPIELREEVVALYNNRNKARKAGNKDLGDKLHDEYKVKKDEAIAVMKQIREDMGQTLDEFGQPDPQSYGRYEINQEQKLDKLQRQQGG